ncbi:hypothetical protein I547_6494 [Mycobacterium kansasii 824]|uniref:Uncharacterized protein n=1 Tax=Mycobacterium kansasii TaxID=1768 RepID=A0A1V3XEX2_MYCKA|nr:hypothetical protein I547_6494 [Mycobacterium kansasii 824]OOK77296.1 hypothetical protein BZL29_3201 [Mycobacterium kansasii]
MADLASALPALSDTIPGLPHAPAPAAQSRSEFDAAGPTFARLPDDTRPLPERPDIALALTELPGSPRIQRARRADPRFG